MDQKQKLAVFKKSVKGLLKQNKQSKINFISDGYAYCAYRAEDGCKCAIGMLIKDETYLPSIEGASIEHNKVHKVLEKSGIKVETCGDINFLRGLQMIHDQFTPEWWEEEFTEFARKFLGFSQPNAIQLVTSLKPKEK